MPTTDEIIRELTNENERLVAAIIEAYEAVNLGERTTVAHWLAIALKPYQAT